MASAWRGRERSRSRAARAAAAGSAGRPVQAPGTAGSFSALEAAPAPDYSTTLSDQSRPLRERLAEFSRAVAAENPGDTEELAVYLEFFAALLRSQTRCSATAAVAGAGSGS